MKTLYHTRDMAAGIEDVASSYPKVIVRVAYSLFKPIRLRRDLVPWGAMSITPTLGKDRMPRFAEAAKALLIYERQLRRREELPPHNVHFFVECPLSIFDLMRASANADIAVVFRPPRWEEHWRAVGARYPTVRQAKRFWRYVWENDGRLIHRRAMSELGVDNHQYKRLIATVLCFSFYNRIQLVRLYRAPERQPVWRALWDRILTFERQDDVFIVTDNHLAPVTVHWRGALRRMHCAGHIQVVDDLVDVFDHHPLPNWRRIEREHTEAGKDLEAVITAVDSSPPLALRSRSPSLYETRPAQSPAHVSP